MGTGSVCTSAGPLPRHCWLHLRLPSSTDLHAVWMTATLSAAGRASVEGQHRTRQDTYSLQRVRQHLRHALPTLRPNACTFGRPSTNHTSLLRATVRTPTVQPAVPQQGASSTQGKVEMLLGVSHHLRQGAGHSGSPCWLGRSGCPEPAAGPEGAGGLAPAARAAAGGSAAATAPSGRWDPAHAAWLMLLVLLAEQPYRVDESGPPQACRDAGSLAVLGVLG